MPYALPPEFNNQQEWEPSSNDYVLVDEGIWLASIFEVTPKSNDKGKFYQLTFRIQESAFDGEDVKISYVGLTPDTMFRIYEILKAIGTIDTYYNAEKKLWIALPTPEELQGQSLYVKVDHEAFHASKDGTYQYNEDGSARVLESARPTRFFPANEPKPEYRAPGTRTVNLLGDKAKKVPYVKGQPVFAGGSQSAAAQGQAFPAGPGAVPTNQPGVTYTDETPW